MQRGLFVGLHDGLSFNLIYYLDFVKEVTGVPALGGGMECMHNRSYCSTFGVPG